MIPTYCHNLVGYTVWYNSPQTKTKLGIKTLSQSTRSQDPSNNSEAAIQDLLQELKYRMPNEVYLYADKLEQGDLIKYKQRLKVN